MHSTGPICLYLKKMIMIGCNENTTATDRERPPVLGGGWAPRIVQEAGGEGDEVGGHGELWR